MSTVTLTIPDMTCGHCVASITKIIEAEGGTARADLDRQQVSLTGIEQARALDLIRAAGFSPEPV
ncbi:MAG: heavy-metal-associated domain-containing protein [Paracoccus sp. (in: a-proteobacteria)]|nr:heavy-metal-associated domain-containing protein [Paracoccus sp. (in: a-proteobacteria)]